jgi:hypothetical protein
MDQELLCDIRQLMAHRDQVGSALINAHLLVLWWNSTYYAWDKLVKSDEGRTWALWGYELKNPQQ